MKFISFLNEKGEKRAGWIDGNRIFDMNALSEGKLPDNMLDFIKNQQTYLPIVERLIEKVSETHTHTLNEVKLTAPLPNPTSMRDFIAFEKHAVNAAKRSGSTVPATWYEIPVFYFTNHQEVFGPNDDIARPVNCRKLDYELEMACVIGKEGRNIKAEEAEDYIFGYTIFNDWSARDLQGKEMKAGLGPAKGKDFANSIGPYIVTKDELEPYREGNKLNLTMTAKINGKLISEGNFKDIYYTFGQMIERASDSVTLYPGDVIGSGTVGEGCLLELGPSVHRWLEPEDIVELEITGLGKLKNRIV